MRTDAILQTSTEGRAFIAEGKVSSLIVTAAHCLPFLPEPHPARYSDAAMYFDFLGPLGQNTSIAAELRFVDLIADIAILGEPDGQEFPEHSEDYFSLVDSIVPLPVADLEYRMVTECRLLTLAGKWIDGMALPLWRGDGGALLSVEKCSPEGWARGCSGSPIVDRQGRAIGLVSAGTFNPALTRAVPERFWRPRRPS
jgi:hypothetical protein